MLHNPQSIKSITASTKRVIIGAHHRVFTLLPVNKDYLSDSCSSQKKINPLNSTRLTTPSHTQVLAIQNPAFSNCGQFATEQSKTELFGSPSTPSSSRQGFSLFDLTHQGKGGLEAGSSN